jgi:diguanylate cyclase (GGDEF)-like protein/PAS domain S-box-containing protein
MSGALAATGADGESSLVTSDRVALEAHLRDSRRQLSDAQALAHVGSWEWNSSQGQAIWSSELCRIFGQPQGFSPTLEEFRALVHPDDVDAVVEQLDSSTLAHRSESSFRIVRPDGEIRHVHGRRYGRAEDLGGVTHLFGTIQDVTEQRIAEIARREAQELFETAFARAPIGMALVDLDGSWMKVNEAVCTMLGWPEAELLQRTFQDITHPDDLDADLAQVQLLIAGELTEYQMEKRYITRSGSRIWVHLSVSLVRDEHGRPRHFISQLEDITQRKQDERRLRAAEADALIQRDHATAIISAMHEGYLLTVEGEIKAVNEALTTLTGFSEAELVGQRVPFPFTPPERLAENMELRRQILDARGGTIEATLMRKDGERFEAEITAKAAADQAGNVIGFVNTIRDVSVERRQRRELEILARTDSLTGLANRHVLQESLERAAALARRHHRRLAMVLLDLDWFKQVNDRYGHPVGDTVLIEVARRLEQTVRDGEVLARVGGEEFAWVLPDATVEEAMIAADRARTVIDAVPFETAGQLTMSAGVGVMESPPEGDALYRLADRALYAAKQEGRNRTSCMSAEPPAALVAGQQPA